MKNLNYSSTWFSAVCLLFLSSQALFSADAAESVVKPQTTICEPTTVIVSTPFNEPTPKTRKGNISGWRVAIGEWFVENNVLTGNELEEDHHPTSCVFPVSGKNIIIHAECRLGAASFIAFACRDNVAPNLHLARTFISPTGLWIQHMTGIGKTTKATKIGKLDIAIDADVWHKVTIEFNGDHYRAQVDDHVLEGKHERFADEKGIIALVVKGQGGQFRNVSLWQGTPK